MTEPMSKEELARIDDADCYDGGWQISAADADRLFEIAEDHARLSEIIRAGSETLERQRAELEQNREDWNALRAENAKLRERVEKLESAGATVLRGFEEGAFVRDTRGDGDPAWAIKLLPYLRALSALAATEEETAK